MEISNTLDPQAGMAPQGSAPQLPPQDPAMMAPEMAPPLAGKFQDSTSLEQGYKESEKAMHQANQEAARSRKALEVIAQASGKGSVEELISFVEQAQQEGMTSESDNLSAQGGEDPSMGQPNQAPESGQDPYQQFTSTPMSSYFDGFQGQQGQAPEPEINPQIEELQRQVEMLSRSQNEEAVRKFQEANRNLVDAFVSENPDADSFKEELLYQVTLPANEGKDISEVYKERYEPVVSKIRGSAVEKFGEREGGSMVSQSGAGSPDSGEIDTSDMSAAELKSFMKQKKLIQ